MPREGASTFDSVTVIYGSQTGTAADVASWLTERLRSKLSNCKCCEGNAILPDEDFSSGGLNVFIISTAGNGDFPSNFKRLWDGLVELSERKLPRFKFAVFGLGDSKYPQFNYAARRAFGRLVSLGGEPVVQLGCGDEQHTLGYSQELVPWVNLLWKTVFGTDFGGSEAMHFTKYNVFPVSHASSVAPSSPFQGSARIVQNMRETSDDHFQEVRRIKLNLVQRWEYQPGDVLCIVPQVSLDVARPFIVDVLKDEPSRTVAITNTGSGSIASGEYSLLELFTEYLDITALPPLIFFEALRDSFVEQMDSLNRQLTEEENLVMEKVSLLADFSALGANERVRYSVKERLGIWEVLRDFHQVTMTVSTLLDVVPRILPRYYSVANKCDSTHVTLSSSAARVPVTTVEICVGLVQYTTLFGRPREGLTSKYLKYLHVGSVVNRVWLERGFSTCLGPTLNDSSQLLLVGPGTGLAPLRAITQHFAESKDILLLTSFRNVKSDFLFRSDISEAFKSDRTKCVVAWSRPDRMDRSLDFSWSFFGCGEAERGTGPDEGRKTWVQDLMHVQADRVRHMLSFPDAVVVIAGRSHPMPYQVLEAMEEIVGSPTVASLTRAGRIIYDTWG